MDIKILGTGCVNCKNLETLTRAALARLGLDAEIDKATAPDIVTGAIAPASVKGVTTTGCPRLAIRIAPSSIG